MLAKLFARSVEDVPSSVVCSAEARLCTMPLSQFAQWLAEADETERLSCAHLKALYAEFALFTDTRALSPGSLFRGLRAAGIRRYREGTGDRRWYYRVVQVAPVNQMPRRRRVPLSMDSN